MFLLLVFTSLLIQSPSQSQAENRAVAYLAREVPSWSRDNHCFSCHNNGDGARALYVAKRMGVQVPPEAFSETTRWVTQPGEWNKDQGGGGFTNKTLAPIQFAASLVEAFDAELVTDRSLITQAAEELLMFQAPDGSWEVNTGAAAASPVTYGTTLATYMARRTLEKSGDPRFAEAIDRAGKWLLDAPPNNIMNAAAIVLAFSNSPDSSAQGKARVALEVLTQSQGSDGGFGPYANSPSEVFDTAIALLALASWQDRPGTAGPIQRGRAFLTEMQLADGGWTETTRPSGGSSYAQHISTCGWATLALIQTR